MCASVCYVLLLIKKSFSLWRDQMIREHYADFEAAGYFDRHPEQRPSLEPRTNPEESTPPGGV